MNEHTLLEEDIAGIRAVTDYIDTHLKEDTRMDVLVNIAHMSLAKLKYTFRAVTGQTPGTYRAEKRLALSLILLETTDLTIEQIAHEVGYKKPGSFTEMFRRRMGMLPSEYRVEH